MLWDGWTPFEKTIDLTSCPTITAKGAACVESAVHSFGKLIERKKWFRKTCQSVEKTVKQSPLKSLKEIPKVLSVTRVDSPRATTHIKQNHLQTVCKWFGVSSSHWARRGYTLYWSTVHHGATQKHTTQTTIQVLHS